MMNKDISEAAFFKVAGAVLGIFALSTLVYSILNIRVYYPGFIVVGAFIALAALAFLEIRMPGTLRWVILVLKGIVFSTVVLTGILFCFIAFPEVSWMENVMSFSGFGFVDLVVFWMLFLKVDN